MNWLFLYTAVAFEVAGTTALKLSAGLARPAFFGIALALYGLSFTLLALSLRVLPIGVAYAIWSGFGTVLVALVGAALFKEPFTALKLVFFALIVVGCVGLNLATGAAPAAEAAGPR